MSILVPKETLKKSLAIKSIPSAIGPRIGRKFSRLALFANPRARDAAMQVRMRVQTMSTVEYEATAIVTTKKHPKIA